MTQTLEMDLAKGLEALGMVPDPTVLDRLVRYLALLMRWNQVYNLTAIRDPEAMRVQHLMDCLAVVPALRRHWATQAGVAMDRPPRVLDVGSGAGLPGVVIAICEPAWSVACVDTVGKKASFIQQAALELGLDRLQSHHARVEQLTLPPIDIVTSRAFASLVDFTQLTRQHLGPLGVWAAMKARLGEDERQALPKGVDLFHVEPLSVPDLSAERCLVWMRPANDGQP